MEKSYSISQSSTYNAKTIQQFTLVYLFLFCYLGFTLQTNMTTSIPQSPTDDDNKSFDLNLQHGHKDLVQAIAFNAYGDRCATGSVDGKIRVFNRHKDATWRLCDTWSAHGGEVIEVC